jgi:hypothetical protein
MSETFEGGVMYECLCVVIDGNLLFIFHVPKHVDSTSPVLCSSSLQFLFSSQL